MFRDNFDVADSITPRISGDAGLTVSNSEMNAFQKMAGNQSNFEPEKLGLAGDDLIVMTGDAAGDQNSGDMASHAQAIGDLLKGASPEDAAEAFTDYMEQNGDAMYEAANAAQPDDPLGYIAEQLNKQLERTDYYANEQERAMEIEIMSRSSGFVASVPVGPTLEDMLGIPQ